MGNDNAGTFAAASGVNVAAFDDALDSFMPLPSASKWMVASLDTVVPALPVAIVP